MSASLPATGKDVRDAIKRICTAYSVRNNVIGYCQGFNFIVGRLLQVMTEEEAFWTFTRIIELMMRCQEKKPNLVDKEVINCRTLGVIKKAIRPLMIAPDLLD